METARGPGERRGAMSLSRDGGIDELKVAGLTLRGVARGGVETCLMVPELGLMFDVGMVVPGCHSYREILVSHGHADHLGGIAYLLSQRQLMRLPPPIVRVPEEIVAPLRVIIDAWGVIEGLKLDVDLRGHAPGDRVELGRGLVGLARRSSHRVPSLAWAIERETQRLKDELRGEPGEAIAALRREGVEVTSAHREVVLCVTGDTQIELLLGDPVVAGAKVLVHEVTSWDQRRDLAATRRWGHTHLDEMVEHVERFTGEALVLVHRSLRHSREDAARLVRERFPRALQERIHVFGR